MAAERLRHGLEQVGDEAVGGEELGVCLGSAALESDRRRDQPRRLAAAREAAWQLAGVALEVLVRHGRVIAAIHADGAEQRVLRVLAAPPSRASRSSASASRPVPASPGSSTNSSRSARWAAAPPPPRAAARGAPRARRQRPRRPSFWMVSEPARGRGREAAVLAWGSDIVPLTRPPVAGMERPWPARSLRRLRSAAPANVSGGRRPPPAAGVARQGFAGAGLNPAGSHRRRRRLPSVACAACRQEPLREWLGHVRRRGPPARPTSERAKQRRALTGAGGRTAAGDASVRGVAVRHDRKPARRRQNPRGVTKRFRCSRGAGAPRMPPTIAGALVFRRAGSQRRPATAGQPRCPHSGERRTGAGGQATGQAPRGARPWDIPQARRLNEPSRLQKTPALPSTTFDAAALRITSASSISPAVMSSGGRKRRLCAPAAEDDHAQLVGLAPARASRIAAVRRSRSRTSGRGRARSSSTSGRSACQRLEPAQQVRARRSRRARPAAPPR